MLQFVSICPRSSAMESSKVPQNTPQHPNGLRIGFLKVGQIGHLPGLPGNRNNLGYG
jgi:hypothetical protein